VERLESWETCQSCLCLKGTTGALTSVLLLGARNKPGGGDLSLAKLPLEVSIRVQSLPKCVDAVDVGMVQPEYGIESRHFQSVFLLKSGAALPTLHSPVHSGVIVSRLRKE
jgi:hypothetical protein